MDNALFQKISKAMARAEKATAKSLGRKLKPDEMEEVDETVCYRNEVHPDDFFAACMERAVV